MRYSDGQRRAYLDFTDYTGGQWVQVFDGDTDFYNAAYWDLMKAMWRATEPVRKTDALRFMTAIKSAHTAGKYLDVALQKGLIVERDNPDDARSKLLDLSPDMRARMDAFFDKVIERLHQASRDIGGGD